MAPIALAFTRPPAHEAAWARGASGEEHVARVLARRLGDRVVILHDRRMPAGRGNIDHIVIAATGVWVVDAKRYAGRVAVRRPLLGRARLTVGGRDRSGLADGMARQVAVVRDVVEAVAPSSPVHGVLCFVDARLPLVGSATFDGWALLSPDRLASRIDRRGGLDAGIIAVLAAHLGRRLPPA